MLGRCCENKKNRSIKAVYGRLAPFPHTTVCDWEARERRHLCNRSEDLRWYFLRDDKNGGWKGTVVVCTLIKQRVEENVSNERLIRSASDFCSVDCSLTCSTADFQLSILLLSHKETVV